MQSGGPRNTLPSSKQVEEVCVCFVAYLFFAVDNSCLVIRRKDRQTRLTRACLQICRLLWLLVARCLLLFCRSTHPQRQSSTLMRFTNCCPMVAHKKGLTFSLIRSQRKDLDQWTMTSGSDYCCGGLVPWESIRPSVREHLERVAPAVPRDAFLRGIGSSIGSS